METVLHLIFAFIALGILIFVHELGHYWVALRVGMVVEVFSIGFGRPITSWMRGNVRWQIGWIPFGGFVKIAGMEFGKEARGEIPGGFFTKRPWDRLKVAIAGPLANLILAFLIFCVIWITGGREKPFSEFTNRIGWLDSSSELYKQGIRAGDSIKTYNGNHYEGIKDLFYASMLSDEPIELKGYKINETNFDKVPYDYTIKPYQMPGATEGLRTTGVLNPARYLNYAKFPNGEENPLPEGSPMKESQIQYGDRIVWADGAVIYSQDQLSALINESKSLLTIQRGHDILLARIPRVVLSELKLSSETRGELSDWQHLTDVKGRLSSLYFIPYNINSENVVEEEIPFIDPDAKKALFSKNGLTSKDIVLEKGDKILAVDTVSVSRPSDLLEALQTRKAVMIVQRGQKVGSALNWKEADEHFNQKPFIEDLQVIVSSLGGDKPLSSYHDFVLLKPIEPKTVQSFVMNHEQKAELQAQLAAQKKQIDEIGDPQKRSRALQAFEDGQKRLMLGIYFQDETVRYNPGPWILFANVFSETWHTLIALFSGYLNPKWLSGPVGIIQVIQHGWSVGIKEALFWIAAISINLGFLNLLPLPVLDGGYIVLSFFEMITGRRLKPKTLERLIVPFVVLLIGFLIFVTYWDLIRLF